MFFGFGFTNSAQEFTLDLNNSNQLQNLSLTEILSISNIINKVKQSSTQFTKILMQRRTLLYDLIDYALLPELFESQTNKININNPYICSEIINSLSNEFYDELFKIDTTQEKNEGQKSSLTMIEYVFRVLRMGSNKVNETAVGYLSKLISQIVYRKDMDLFYYLEKNPEIMDLLFKHSYSKSIIQIISKLICLENQSILDSKIKILYHLFENISKETNKNDLSEKLENLNVITQQLIQKAEERYDGPKFLPIVKKLIGKDSVDIIEGLISKNQCQNSIIVNCIEILINFLNFYKLEKNKEATNHNQYQNQKREVVLIQFDLIEQIKKIAHELSILLSEHTKQCHELSILNIKILSLYDHLLFLQPDYFQSLISLDFITKNLSIMKLHPFNNILHNLQKSILIVGIKNISNEFLYKKEYGLINFIMIELSTREKYEAGYKNQLYHLANQIQNIAVHNSSIKPRLNKQYEQWNKFIQTIFIERKKTYKRLLGGQNPKAKNQSFIDQQFEVTVQKKTHQNNTIQEQNLKINDQQDLVKSEDQQEQDVNLEIESDDEKTKPNTFQPMVKIQEENNQFLQTMNHLIEKQDEKIEKMSQQHKSYQQIKQQQIISINTNNTDSISSEIQIKQEQSNNPNNQFDNDHKNQQNK